MHWSLLLLIFFQTVHSYFYPMISGSCGNDLITSLKDCEDAALDLPGFKSNPNSNMIGGPSVVKNSSGIFNGMALLDSGCDAYLRIAGDFTSAASITFIGDGNTCEPYSIKQHQFHCCSSTSPCICKRVCQVGTYQHERPYSSQTDRFQSFNVAGYHYWGKYYFEGKKYDASVIKSCKNCPEGYYQDETDKTVCKTCVAGKYNSQVSKTKCLSCPDGYVSSESSSSCTQCTGGSHSSEDRTTCISTCPIGYYIDGLSCRACEAGKYNNATNQTSCKSCSAGTYQNEEGQNACKDCPIGTWSSTTANTGISQCINCNNGKYNLKTGQTNESACKTCVEGQYTLSPTSQCKCVIGAGIYNEDCRETARDSLLDYFRGAYHTYTTNPDCSNPQMQLPRHIQLNKVLPIPVPHRIWED